VTLLGILLCLQTVGVTGSAAADREVPANVPASPAAGPAERHLANVRQVTFGNKNAEAYFSFDGTKLIFQSTTDYGDGPQNMDRPPTGQALGCYQMYVLDLESGNIRRVSTGVGATTCGYFFPGDRRVLYASTHLVAPGCPPKPKIEGRYRWALDDYDIFSVKVDGQQVQRLTTTPGYDAEATVSPDGKTIVFTSVRDGDLELYAMNLDGTHLRRLTHELGYDGGAFFSPDNQRIVYRASHPRDPDEAAQYKNLLSQRLVEPSQLELFVMNADGTAKRQVTANGASNFAPFFHPDGRRIIFSSNVHEKRQGASSPSGPPTFHLHLIGEDGGGLEQVTSIGAFNSFPMFSPDGRKLVWISDRGARARGEFNIFLADWVP
jgi:Tol biopolymer transport system component